MKYPICILGVALLFLGRATSQTIGLDVSTSQLGLPLYEGSADLLAWDEVLPVDLSDVTGLRRAIFSGEGRPKYFLRFVEGRVEGVFYDRFEWRDDTLNGDVGRSYTNDIYNPSTGFDDGVLVLNGELTALDNKKVNTYIYVGETDGLNFVPDAYAWEVGWQERAGPDSGGAVFLQPNIPRTFQHMIHMNFGPDGLLFELWPDGLAETRIQLARLRFVPFLPANGESHVFGLRFIGNNQVEVQLPEDGFSAQLISGASTASINQGKLVVTHPTLDTYKTKYPCWQIIQNEDPIRTTHYRRFLAYTSENEQLVRDNSLFPSYFNLLDGLITGPDTRYIQVQNGAQISTTTRVATHEVDMTNIQFYVRLLPSPSAFGIGEILEISDTTSTMDPANPDFGFVQLNIPNGVSLAGGNPSHAPNVRFIGGTIRMLAKDASTWEVLQAQ